MKVIYKISLTLHVPLDLKVQKQNKLDKTEKKNLRNPGMFINY